MRNPDRKTDKQLWEEYSKTIRGVISQFRSDTPDERQRKGIATRVLDARPKGMGPRESRIWDEVRGIALREFEKWPPVAVVLALMICLAQPAFAEGRIITLQTGPEAYGNAAPIIRVEDGDTIVLKPAPEKVSWLKGPHPRIRMAYKVLFGAYQWAAPWIARK